MAKCTECEQLRKFRQKVWQEYQDQLRRNRLESPKQIKPAEETDRLLEEFRVASARWRHHLAVKHADQGHHVSEADLRLLEKKTVQ